MHKPSIPCEGWHGENRALAQVAKERVPPTGNTAFAGRCAPPRARLVEHYNNIRLNSAIGYITPKDMLAGGQQEIHTQRDRKLAAARCQRQISRQQARLTSNGQQQLLPKVPILSLNMDI
jgi:hypothetical protein